MVECCNAPRPTLQKTSSYSEFRRVFYLLVALHHVISCIASFHHVIFKKKKTQLNKLHRSFDLFKLREFTMVISLYNISSQYLGSYIKPFHCLGITHNTFGPFFKFPFYPIQLLFFLWSLLVKLSCNFTLSTNVPNQPINHI